MRLLTGRVAQDRARIETDPASAHRIRSEHRLAYRPAHNCFGGYRDQCEPFRQYFPAEQWPTQKTVERINREAIEI